MTINWCLTLLETFALVSCNLLNLTKILALHLSKMKVCCPIICREWTLNMISEWFVESANHTCGPYDPEIDELELAGFTPVPSQKVRNREEQFALTAKLQRCASSTRCSQHVECQSLHLLGYCAV